MEWRHQVRAYLATVGVLRVADTAAPGYVLIWVVMCTPRRYRLVVDESLALGVLGEHGRGACEHWGLKPGDAEIVSASIGALPAFLSISLAARLALVSCPQSCIQRRS